VLATPDWQIKASDLHKTYASNGLHAVCGNTFGVKQGSILGLLGPNGAGKSSTFSVLAMELARTAGEVYLLGESVEKISLDKKGKLFGMCP
jgi:ABC-type multidrug transport system ATPase subunit